MSTVDTFNPMVSIVLPVYNGANYMREAIDSALAQTYKNIEIIVVNDGSRDNGETDRIARGYGDRIRYFQKENGGCGSALNLGISHIRGEYFSWLSHDDVYYPEKIAHQIDVLRTLENRDAILYGGWECIDTRSKSIAYVHPEATYSRTKLNAPLYALLRGLIHGCTLLVPAKYFRRVGVFNEALPTTHDYALWFDFMRVAPVYFDSKVLIKSRVHSDQSTHRIPTHVEECNELWCGFLERLTDAEMEAMEGSRYLFLRETAKFLATTPYDKARDLARSMAQATLNDTGGSVVIPRLPPRSLLATTMRSLRNDGALVTLLRILRKLGFLP